MGLLLGLTKVLYCKKINTHKKIFMLNIILFSYKPYQGSFSRVCKLNKYNNFKVCVRTMISSKNIYAIRALYNAAMMLSNNEMLDKINSKDTKPFVERAVDLALDDTKGVLQQKAAILKHITNHRFPAEYFFEHFRELTRHNNVHWEPNTNIDCRTISELGTLNDYLNKFNKDIVWTLATLDQRASNFPGAKQPNVDFWVYIDRALGLTGAVAKGVYQDEKSGMDMLKHSSRGSIGSVSFDADGNNIQTMHELITEQTLAEADIRKMQMITQVAETDGYAGQFKITFREGIALCNAMKNKGFTDVAKLHNQLQDLLWEQLQCHPEFKRSISFLFIKQIVTHPASIKEEAFSRAFEL